MRSYKGDFMTDITETPLVQPAIAGGGKYCAGCAAMLHKDAAQCPKCGAPQAVAGQKSKVTAGLFALFLGGIGGHKFYLGRPLAGVIYLLFFWTLIPAFIAFIEGLIYLTMGDDAFRRKYG